MARENILAVDDEEDILELLEYNLVKNGYRVTCVTTGEAALEAARAHVPDVLLLDLMLPGLDGLEVCKILKNDPKTSHIPVVMLTAKGEDADVVTGLEIGADDYVTKPFSPRVLLARIRAVLRRRAKVSSDANATITIYDLVVNPARHEVIAKGNVVDLSYTEFRILQFLAGRPGRVFSRYDIIDAIRGVGYPVTDRSVDVQIAGLRKKLGPCADYIETVRGVGYRFKD